MSKALDEKVKSISEIMDDMGNGRKNISGDYWCKDWCLNAKNLISDLHTALQESEATIGKLKTALEQVKAKNEESAQPFDEGCMIIRKALEGL